MTLRRFKVTVMDNWTPMRSFWTLRSALKFRDKHPRTANIYVWYRGAWQFCRV